MLSKSGQCVADDTQTALGGTQPPAVLAVIVEDIIQGLQVPDVSHLPTLYRTLHIGANVCIDHGASWHPFHP